jgi:Integrase core domain
VKWLALHAADLDGDNWLKQDKVDRSEIAGLSTEEALDLAAAKRRIKQLAIHDYIELFHNTRRRHSALGMLSPTEYEDLHNTTQGAA